MKKIFLIILSLFIIISFTTNAYSMSALRNIGKKILKEGMENVDSIWKKIGSGGDNIVDTPSPSWFEGIRIPPTPFYRLGVEGIKKLKEKFPKEYEEIKSWKAPTNLNDDEKVAYQLSCVVVIESQLGRGSGFYINEDTIISNHHVVEGKKQVNIKGFLKDNFINGNVIAYDKNLDLSAIKTSKGDHRPCIIEQSNSPPILSEVIAIGHPEGIEYRVTKGEISSYVDINKNYINDPNSIQVALIDMSADIYFGSSGGPLFYKGNVIGVVVGGIKDANINFAIHFRKVNEFINKKRL